MTQFTIPACEYDSLTGKQLPLQPSPFNVNDKQLIIAIVRSILSKSAGKAVGKYVAAIVKPTLDFLIDWSRCPNLCLSRNIGSAFRDFSLTSRIGELAQGVSYAYWHWDRGYVNIADFRTWVRGLGIPYKGTTYPDFVMLNHKYRRHLAILECKGTCSSNYRSPMKAALEQCAGAQEHTPCSRSFGSVLTLDSRSPVGRGVLHIRDPEQSIEIPDILAHYTFRQSYSSWFDLTGEYDLARKCRKPFYESEELLDSGPYKNKNLEGSENYAEVLRDATLRALGLSTKFGDFGIDPQIRDGLFNFEKFRQIDWNKIKQRKVVEEDSTSSALFYFPDGTFIRFLNS